MTIFAAFRTFALTSVYVVNHTHWAFNLLAMAFAIWIVPYFRRSTSSHWITESNTSAYRWLEDCTYASACNCRLIALATTSILIKDVIRSAWSGSGWWGALAFACFIVPYPWWCAPFLLTSAFTVLFIPNITRIFAHLSVLMLLLAYASTTGVGMPFFHWRTSTRVMLSAITWTLATAGVPIIETIRMSAFIARILILKKGIDKSCRGVVIMINYMEFKVVFMAFNVVRFNFKFVHFGPLVSLSNEMSIEPNFEYVICCDVKLERRLKALIVEPWWEISRKSWRPSITSIDPNPLRSVTNCVWIHSRMIFFLDDLMVRRISGDEVAMVWDDKDLA